MFHLYSHLRAARAGGGASERISSVQSDRTRGGQSLTSEAKKRELSAYRLRQAEESLEDAAFLLSGKKSPRSVINRAYYSKFYALLALLVHEPYSSSKHSGVLSYFNRYFIKDGLLPETPRSLNKQGIRTASTRRLPQVCRADP
ncbi:MAG TPA: hypothetical protein DCS05_10770 [Nitrospiraceae bacterium]|nr:hypothetical protein [Nitrospiraceae bacterium]